jgi:hypothetical protein
VEGAQHVDHLTEHGVMDGREVVASTNQLRAVSLTSACNSSSDTRKYRSKLRLVRASNHNLKNVYYHNKSTHHKQNQASTGEGF